DYSDDKNAPVLDLFPLPSSLFGLEGSEEEGIDYFRKARTRWKEEPGALDWLAAWMDSACCLTSQKNHHEKEKEEKEKSKPLKEKPSSSSSESEIREGPPEECVFHSVVRECAERCRTQGEKWYAE